ncbi:hypothetical protein HYFRA_00009924 [Hymenoscyphus fraxineus]|uniref:Zn(2)-C6 fungal-type domain-containing protein n=1 Tax=Hymenoscyphus fraxineus TaxID=746836 RepID=A0A9N9L6U9_9HELO|nr:hypothetical protein HYFRA_00009924 [Hymenoscyphus fraxineus]
MRPRPAPTFSTTPTFTTSKRSACNRCRAQKLRCPPREKGEEACERCIRLGAQCVTGYSNISTKGGGQVARKQSQGSTTSNRNAPAKLNLGQSLGPETVQVPLPVSSPFLPSTTSTDDDPATWSWAGRAQFSPVGPSDTLPFTFPDGNLDLWANALSYFDSGNFGEGEGNVSGDHEDMCGLSFPEKEQSRNACKPFEVQQPPSPSNTSHTLETDQRLSTLGLNLSIRLQQCVVANNRPWDSTNGDSSSSSSLQRGSSAATTEGTDAMATDPSEIGSANCISFGHALRNTSEFVAIIQSYGAGRSTPQSPNSSPSLGVIATLKILSVYLQVIAIYDRLLGQLHEQLCNSTSQAGFNAESFPGLQTLPGLQLAGLPVNEGNLQTKILIQAILHQLETIENLLGLPAEFRVADRQNVHTRGLLDDERARSLMKAAMTEGRYGTHVAMDDPQEGSELGALASLKRNIQNITQFLAAGTL